jgi:hypothetical protein
VSGKREQIHCRIEEFRIVESDHLPLEISIEKTNHEEMGKGRAKEENKKVKKSNLKSKM